MYPLRVSLLGRVRMCRGREHPFSLPRPLYCPPQTVCHSLMNKSIADRLFMTEAQRRHEGRHSSKVWLGERRRKKIYIPIVLNIVSVCSHFVVEMTSVIAVIKKVNGPCMAAFCWLEENRSDKLGCGRQRCFYCSDEFLFLIFMKKCALKFKGLSLMSVQFFSLYSIVF